MKRGARGMEIARDNSDRNRFMRLLFYVNDEYQHRSENGWEYDVRELHDFERPNECASLPQCQCKPAHCQEPLAMGFACVSTVQLAGPCFKDGSQLEGFDLSDEGLVKFKIKCGQAPSKAGAQE